MAACGTRTRDRNPQGEGGRLREELIAAAGRLLEAGETIDTLTLRGVAREAGVAAPSVYLQFESKEALLRAVTAVHFAALQQAIELGSETITDAPTGLLAGSLAYCRYAMEQPGSYRILFASPRASTSGAGFGDSAGASAFQTLVDAVAECIATGIARPGNPFRIASDIWPALHGIVTLRESNRDFPWPPLDQQVRGILEAFTGIPYEDRVAMEEGTGGAAT